MLVAPPVGLRPPYAATSTNSAPVIPVTLLDEGGPFCTPIGGPFWTPIDRTGVSQRTAKNWLSGKNAPSGVHLVMLARESNAVLKALMLMAERPEMSLGASLLSLKRLLSETMAALDQMM